MMEVLSRILRCFCQDAHAAPSPLKGDPFSSTTVATNEAGYASPEEQRETVVKEQWP